MHYAHEIRDIAKLFRHQARKVTTESSQNLHRGERSRLRKICTQAIRLFAEEVVPELKKVHVKRAEDSVMIFQILKRVKKIRAQFEAKEYTEEVSWFLDRITIKN